LQVLRRKDFGSMGRYWGDPLLIYLFEVTQ
jgi:hypothetical protein